MSKNIDLRVSRSLELLENLKGTVAKFAKQEEQIARDLHSRRHGITLKYQHTLSRAESSRDAHIEGTEESFKTREERIKTTYDARRTRVQRFRKNSLTNLPRRAQEEKGRWMGDLQLKNFLAQKKLKEDLAAADAAYNGFVSKLEVYRSTLRDLEKRAHKAFGGYCSLRKMLRGKSIGPAMAADSTLTGQFEAIRGHLTSAEENLTEFLRFPLPRIFRILLLPVLLLFIIAGGVVLAWNLGFDSKAFIVAGIASAAGFGAVFAVYFMGESKAKPVAAQVAGGIVSARAIIHECEASGSSLAAKREQDRQHIQQDYENACAEVQRQWNRADEVEAEYERKTRHKLETQTPRIVEKIDRIAQQKLGQIAAERTANNEHYASEAAAIQKEAGETFENETAALTAGEKTRWEEIETAWKREITPLYEEITAIDAEVARLFPAWDKPLVDGWVAPAHFVPATKFGHLDLDLTREHVPKDPRLALPGPAHVSLPLALTYPGHGSLLFETKESGTGAMIDTLNNIILRLLSTTPPGKLSFTIVDPVGLGQSFAGLMHIADYEESIINRRIWTQRDQIEERLAELGEHIEKVIQMYLRNEYATITEYNEQAGSVAEKYHFLVVADFPGNFSDIAAKRLQSIAVSGPRCGIFTLIHWDQRQPMPDGFVPDELRKNSICIRHSGNQFTLGKQQMELGATIAFDPPPESDLAVDLIHKIGRSSIDSNRVEVPFTQVAPAPGEMWTNDTTNELRIAVGRTGATKLQYLAIGKGTRQHALFAGKTGSGKSTLFHVIITNLALSCSPEQVEFYLIDFKKGVEFKCYATKHLPHARVVAIESDREFALSVLQRVDAELRRRGDMFRKLGVQDIAGYKRAGGAEPMPRSLLLIDEFQEFFVEDDSIAQTASLLFDRIVRQGRAFGIHVLLGSQTLGGAYSLARATLGQMVIRVALQCNEADAYLIMDESNSAPRLLSRPGEGIYNDAAGAVEGNSPFQVVWLPDDERDAWLDKVHALAESRHQHYPTPIVFEGNAPADITENDPMRAALDTIPDAPPVAARCWLGAPNSIKGPTEAVFLRQSGNNMLIVGQRDESALTMLGASTLALAAQYPRDAAKFVFLHGSVPGSADAAFIEQVVGAIPQEVTVVHGQDVTAAMSNISTELKARSSGEAHSGEAPSVFLFIHGLHKFKKLRHEDDFSFSMGGGDSGPDPGAQFNELISEGSSHGIHIVATVDTLNSVNRFMNRKALSEFEMRVVFQMSANDSASLIESPKASTLGMYRALYYNEHEGYLETFRPYAMIDAGWLRDAAGKLAKRPGAVADTAAMNG